MLSGLVGVLYVLTNRLPQRLYETAKEASMQGLWVQRFSLLEDSTNESASFGSSKAFQHRCQEGRYVESYDWDTRKAFMQ